jgi:hypothetical protein
MAKAQYRQRIDLVFFHNPVGFSYLFLCGCISWMISFFRLITALPVNPSFWHIQFPSETFCHSHQRSCPEYQWAGLAAITIRLGKINAGSIGRINDVQWLSDPSPTVMASMRGNLLVLNTFCTHGGLIIA